MIAEHDACGIAEIAQQAQHAQRLRPTVDEVTHDPQPVYGGIERDPVEHSLEWRVAALDVSDCVGCHLFLSQRPGASCGSSSDVWGPPPSPDQTR